MANFRIGKGKVHGIDNQASTKAQTDYSNTSYIVSWCGMTKIKDDVTGTRDHVTCLKCRPSG